MEINKLTIDQRLQIARMATDLVAAGMQSKQPVRLFTDEAPPPRTDHELFTFIYHVIEEVVTNDFDSE